MGFLASYFGSTWPTLVAALVVTLSTSFMHSCEMDKAQAEYSALAEANEENKRTIYMLVNDYNDLLHVKKQLDELHKADNQLVANTTAERDSLAAQNRILSHQLSEAINHEKPATVNTILSDDVSRSLCLRLRAASGLLTARADSAASAGGADTRAAHPGSNTFADCAEWQGRLTVGAVVEWSGALLDHAGAERLDKAALRERNARINTMGQN